MKRWRKRNALPSHVTSPPPPPLPPQVSRHPRPPVQEGVVRQLHWGAASAPQPAIVLVTVVETTPLYVELLTLSLVKESVEIYLTGSFPASAMLVVINTRTVVRIKTNVFVLPCSELIDQNSLTGTVVRTKTNVLCYSAQNSLTRTH